MCTISTWQSVDEATAIPDMQAVLSWQPARPSSKPWGKPGSFDAYVHWTTEHTKLDAQACLRVSAILALTAKILYDPATSMATARH